MRGGRNIVECGASAGRGASGATPMSPTFTATRICWTLGMPWNPQQEQMPLQLSGATGWECLKLDCCTDAVVKEMPSHRSQWGGFAVSQNNSAQSSHAHMRCLFLLPIPLMINGRSHFRSFRSRVAAKDWT